MSTRVGVGKVSEPKSFGFLTDATNLQQNSDGQLQNFNRGDIFGGHCFSFFFKMGIFVPKFCILGEIFLTRRRFSNDFPTAQKLQMEQLCKIYRGHNNCSILS